MAMAQSPESAKHDSILRSAIATGMVDHVLPPEEMPAKLMEYAALPARARASSGTLFDGGAATSSPASARSSAQDRPRLQPLQDEHARPADPAADAGAAGPRGGRTWSVLRQDPKEVGALFRDLLIGVTHFFRDPGGLRRAGARRDPPHRRSRGPDGAIRVWTPGLRHRARRPTPSPSCSGRRSCGGTCRPRVQIFAGDIDDEALEFARAGPLPGGRGRARHARTAGPVLHQAGAQLPGHQGDPRDVHLLHAQPHHGPALLAAGPRGLPQPAHLPGERPAAARATLFHYALRPGGYLFLGPSESVAGPPDLFRTLDKKHRIFQRNETRGPAAARLPAARIAPARAGAAGPGRRAWPRRAQAELGGRPGAAPARPVRARLGHRQRRRARSSTSRRAPAGYLEPAAGIPAWTSEHGAQGPAPGPAHRHAQGGQDRRAGDPRGRRRRDRRRRPARSTSIVRPAGRARATEPGLFLIVFQELGPPARPTRRPPGDGRDRRRPATSSSSSSRASCG